jgi:hypothetical protein
LITDERKRLVSAVSYPDFSNAILMQYETPLPDDFDMEGVRTRVREKAGVFDQLPGMFVKFYAVNEKTNTSLNEYSSIYLWSKPSFLTEFFTELIDFQFTAEPVAHPVGMNARQYDIVHVSLPSAALDK